MAESWVAGQGWADTKDAAVARAIVEMTRRAKAGNHSFKGRTDITRTEKVDGDRRGSWFAAVRRQVVT